MSYKARFTCLRLTVFLHENGKHQIDNIIVHAPVRKQSGGAWKGNGGDMIPWGQQDWQVGHCFENVMETEIWREGQSS